MTRQDHIEHDLRMTIGDLMIQLIAVRGELNELKEIRANEEAAALVDATPEPPSKANGKAKEVETRQ
jgi:hypothetical protein